MMTEGKSRAEIATFDALIADPADKEKMLARQNQLAQQQLTTQYGLGLPPPRRRKPTEENGNGSGAGNGKPH